LPFKPGTLETAAAGAAAEVGRASVPAGMGRRGGRPYVSLKLKFLFRLDRPLFWPAAGLSTEYCSSYIIWNLRLFDGTLTLQILDDVRVIVLFGYGQRCKTEPVFGGNIGTVLDQELHHLAVSEYAGFY